MTELSLDSTIETVIEDDASYRTRLKAVVGYPIFDVTKEAALDEIGAKCRVYRRHTHICKPVPKSEAA